jgi:O-antigen/teichoic acid export membrane protein
MTSTHDPVKTSSINKDIPPSYEPHLRGMLQKAVKEGRLKCVLNRKEAILAQNEQVSVKKAARGVLYLYLSSVITMVFGYLYWAIVSKMVTPDAVGLASTTVSIATLVSILTIFGVPVGVQRFLGKSFGNHDANAFRSYFMAGMTFLVLSGGVTALILVSLSGFVSSFIGIPLSFIVIAAIMVFTGGLATLFRVAYTASIRTDIPLYSSVIASAARLALGVVFISVGLEALGVAVGYLISGLVLLTFLAILGTKLLGLRVLRLTFFHTKEIVQAGFVNWMPTVIATMGTQLSVIAVYGFHGSFEAGLYYISFAMASVISSVSASVMGLSFPILSGMTDGRKRACWRAIRMALVFTVPLAASLAAYPEVALGFFSSDYVVASNMLLVLLFATVPQGLIDGVNFLAYAYGKYRLVLVMGLAISVPRTVMYMLLTPSMGGLGAAFALLSGTVIGLVTAFGVTNRIGLKFQWKDLIVAFIPLAMTAVCKIPIPWFLGVTIVLTGSALTYTRLRLVTRRDLKESAEAFLPQSLLSIGLRRFGWILRMLFGKQRLS